jgi:hypothetical protein
MQFPLASIPFGEIVGEVIENNLHIHFEYTKTNFKLSDYKSMLDIWADVLLGLKDTGVKTIYSCIPKEEIKTNKFQVMFGLHPYKETEQLTIYRMEL